MFCYLTIPLILDFGFDRQTAFTQHKYDHIRSNNRKEPQELP
jgi:hypothetical protein